MKRCHAFIEQYHHVLTNFYCVLLRQLGRRRYSPTAFLQLQLKEENYSIYNFLISGLLKWGLPALFLEHMQCFYLATHWARKTVLIKELQRCLVEL